MSELMLTRMSRLFAERNSLVLFFALAYVFSWGNFFLAARFPNFPFLYPFGPLLAAVILASVTGGMKEFLGSCLRWRAGLQWYAAALFVPIAIGLITVFLNVMLGASLPTSAQLGPWYNIFLLFPIALIDAPFGEESGWRGFALPKFPAIRSPLFNTLILGLLIVGWHVPLALSQSAITLPYLIACLASVIVTNWVYYNAYGSALLAMVYHSSANTMGLYFSPLLSGQDLVRYFWLLAGVNWVVAVIVLSMTGQTLQRRRIEPMEAV